MMNLRGVNLGGWLILEKWITPSLFEGFNAEDEYSFSLIDADNGYKGLNRHRKNFITKKDFEWLAQNQFNAVRIPVGYWALDDDPPYANCQVLLDKAFQWAQEAGISVVLDLHGVPGSQNGLDHSGKSGTVEWTSGLNISRTLEVLDKLAERYSSESSLWGISLVNEPGWNIPLELSRSFYANGYEVVRKHCQERIAVIISDSFRPTQWNDFMEEPDYKNVVLDSHLYQCFSDEDKNMSLEEHLSKTNTEWLGIIEKSNKEVIIGEWSLGLDQKTFADMSQSQKTEAQASYASAQLAVFDKAAGWFFWTYKTENMHGWNVKDLIDLGLLH